MSARSDLGPKPRLGYVQSRLERFAELRADEAAIAGLAEQPRAGAYVVGGDLIVIKKGATRNDPLFTMPEARALAADRQHDHHRIGAREMLCLARRAIAPPAGKHG